MCDGWMEYPDAAHADDEVEFLSYRPINDEQVEHLADMKLRVKGDENIPLILMNWLLDQPILPQHKAGLRRDIKELGHEAD
jgi:hypothetical protein